MYLFTSVSLTSQLLAMIVIETQIQELEDKADTGKPIHVQP